MTHPMLPGGFRVAGVHCGIKSDPRRRDLSLIACDQPVVAAGVYTLNQVAAAPVEVDRRRTPSDRVRVVVVNSGCANACTGQRGMDDALRMSQLAAEACGADPEQALVMSTGMIGSFLPMDRIERGIRQAAGQLDDGPDAIVAAAEGFLTTDRGIKVASRAVPLGEHAVRLLGIAKGAAMIGPNMATMLACLLTDARLSVPQADAALRRAVEGSFNAISVEGHTSTNDSVLLLASGQAMPAELPEAEALEPLQEALDELCVELARMIPDDGEGSSHLITIDVRGCRSRDEARHIARTVANSPLVKTAVAGADPNWGRIISAVGYAGIPLAASRIALSINGRLLYRDGGPVPFDARDVSRSMADNRNVEIALELGDGPGAARFWTSDLTVDYVRFNSEYTT